MESFQTRTPGKLSSAIAPSSSPFINTPAGPVPIATWHQWQALADQAAQNRGAPAGASSGMALHMQLKQWQDSQHLGHPQPQIAMRGGRPAVGSIIDPLAPPRSSPHSDPSNDLLHALLSEAVTKSMSTQPSRKAVGKQPIPSGSEPVSPRRHFLSAAEGSLPWPRENYDPHETTITKSFRKSYAEGYGDEYDEGADEDEESVRVHEDGEQDGALAVDTLFGQVLSLQERLQHLDTENALLKQQLKDQKGLMQQMQAALLDQDAEGVEAVNSSQGTVDRGAAAMSSTTAAATPSDAGRHLSPSILAEELRATHNIPAASLSHHQDNMTPMLLVTNKQLLGVSDPTPAHQGRHVPQQQSPPDAGSGVWLPDWPAGPSAAASGLLSANLPLQQQAHLTEIEMQRLSSSYYSGPHSLQQQQQQHAPSSFQQGAAWQPTLSRSTVGFANGNTTIQPSSQSVNSTHLPYPPGHPATASTAIYSNSTSLYGSTLRPHTGMPTGDYQSQHAALYSNVGQQLQQGSTTGNNHLLQAATASSSPYDYSLHPAANDNNALNMISTTCRTSAAAPGLVAAASSSTRIEGGNPSPYHQVLSNNSSKSSTGSYTAAVQQSSAAAVDEQQARHIPATQTSSSPFHGRHPNYNNNTYDTPRQSHQSQAFLQQQQQQTSSIASGDQLPPSAWACQVCTYEHSGAEALYLRCGICGALK